MLSRKELNKLAKHGQLFGDLPEQLFDHRDASREELSLKEIEKQDALRHKLIATWPKRVARLLYGSAAGRPRKDNKKRKRDSRWYDQWLQLKRQHPKMSLNKASNLIHDGEKQQFGVNDALSASYIRNTLAGMLKQLPKNDRAARRAGA